MMMRRIRSVDLLNLLFADAEYSEKLVHGLPVKVTTQANIIVYLYRTNIGISALYQDSFTGSHR
jgi:hypothetical protein